MDDSGQHVSGYTHDIYKVRLDLDGNHIESEKTQSKLRILLSNLISLECPSIRRILTFSK